MLTSRLTTTVALVLLASGSMARAADPLPTMPQFTDSDASTDVRPCDDLYSYANTKWLRANPVPPDQLGWGTYFVLRARSLAAQQSALAAIDPARADSVDGSAQLAYLYSTGNNLQERSSAGITPMAAELSAIAEISTRDGVQQYLIQSAGLGRALAFSITPGEDHADATQIIAFVNPTGLSMPDPGLYQGADNVKAREAFVAHVAKTLSLAGDDAAGAKRAAADVLRIETRLATALIKGTDQLTGQYNLVSLAEAEAISGFPWALAFRTNRINAETLSLNNPEYFAALGSLLKEESPNAWRSFLRFRALDESAPYLSPEIEATWFDFHGARLGGQKHAAPVSTRVIGAINTVLSEPMGRLYVEQNLSQSTVRGVRGMVDNLRTALAARLRANPWMAKATKRHALEKLGAMRVKIGAPDKWRDYGDLTLRGSYYEAMRTASAFETAFQFSKIGQVRDPDEWTLQPQMADAYYNPARNELVFPAAILQPPFFDPNAAPGLNYGGIGASIGHELIHGYDNTGADFDANGSRRNWWTEADRKRFKERTDRLVAQFSGYRGIDGIHVDGAMTLGENIADLGGLAVASDALRTVTDDPRQMRLLFSNYAATWRTAIRPEMERILIKTDFHAPAKYRVNGPASNLPAFADAFHCRLPSQPIVVW